jgi:phosphopantothenoylcysteine decarboxylase/phosphopantothenate--cysteine ligase
MNKENRNILITGGPTWVKLDDIRVITSIFSGETAVRIADYFKKHNYKVTLVANITGEKLQNSGLKFLPFRYYQDLKRILTSELKRNKFKAIIHTAAVSDYRPQVIVPGKIPSDKNSFCIKLVRTEKIIKTIRSLAPQSYLIQFKLEADKKKLLHKAYHSLQCNKSDLVVANALTDIKSGSYQAYAIDKSNNREFLASKDKLIRYLFDCID